MSKFVLTAQLQLQAPNNVKQVVQKMQSQLNNLKVNFNAQSAVQAQKNIKNLSKTSDQASKSFQSMGKSFSASVRRFSALAIATRAVGLFTSTLSNAVKESIDFERELIKISQVTGKTVSQLQGLTNTITSLSTSLGVSSSSLLGVSRILAQTGLSARDTQIALATLARSDLAPTFDNITQTAEGAVAILNQFGKGASALEAQLSSLNAVAGQFAVEAGDLVAVIRRTGGVFQAAGGDLNELIALFTSVRATTRESAESIATGLRTIFTRIQRPETIEYLKQFGVELVNLEGKFVGPYEAIRQLSAALAGLEKGDLTFVQIAEELGGFRQIGKVIPLLQQFSVAQAALNVAQEGSGSLATDAAKAQAALGVQITKVKEEFLALVRSFTSSTAFQVMADAILKIVSALVKLADTLSPILPLLTAFAGIKILGNVGKGLGGLTGFSDGGKVLKFARGGMVPGSGNRDTVPAMLTPGEFVIKKSSVSKLGAGNLAAMNENKYAAGGIVTSGRHAYGNLTGLSRKEQLERLAEERMAKAAALNKNDIRDKQSGQIQISANKGQIGAFVLSPPKGSDDTYRPQPISFNIPAGSKGAARIAKATGQSPTLAGLQAQLVSSSYPVLYTGGQDIKKNQQINRSIDSGYKSGMKVALEKTISSLQRKKTLDFEPAISTDENLVGTALNQLFTDQQARTSVAGYLFESVITALTGAKASGGQANFDFGRGSLGQNKAKLSGVFGSPQIIQNMVKAEAKRSRGQVQGEITKKTINDIIAGDMSGVSILSSKRPKIQRRAAGGGITGSGTDTVPALLTPGEFVVNKKSAQKIGYGSLNRMNKVAKFAKGGVVGKKVKAFAGGGTSGADTGAVMINVDPLNAALNAVTGILTNTASALSSFTTAALNTSVSLNNLSQATLNNLASTGQITQAESQAAQAVLKSNNATLQALSAKNQEQKASLAAAAADQKEAKESLKAAQGDNAESKSGSGLLLAFTALTSGIGMLIPTIDENSSASTRFAAKLGDLAIQLTTLAFLVQQVNFGKMANEVSGAIGSLGKLGGNFSKLGGILSKIPGASKLGGAVSSVASKTVSKVAGGVGQNANIGATVKALSGLANPLTLFLAAIAAIIAGIYLWNSSVAEAAKAAKNKAIEDGNAAEAVKQAQIEAGGERGKAQAKGMAAGAITGAAIGAFLGPVGVAVGAALGAVIGGFFGDFFTPFDKTAEVLTKTANAAALQNAAQKALAESGKAASEAMQKFRDGNATAAEALAATSAGTAAVVASQQATIAANTALMKNTRTAASAVGDLIVGFTKALTFGLTDGFSLGFGTTAQNEEKAQAQIDEQNKQQKQLSQEAVSQNQPALSALGKQIAVAGGSLSDFRAQLLASNEGLSNLISDDDLKQAFENIQKEVKRAQAAFNAMNLGFQSVNAAASAAALSVDNLISGFDGSSNAIERSIATLEAGITNAAQGISDEAFSSAVDSAAAQIERFGGDATKFKENLNAINTAQKFFVNASNQAKENLRKEFERGASSAPTAEGRRGALADAIVGQMDGVGDGVKKRIKDALAGADISQGDMDKILAGDMSVLDKVLKDLGDTTLSQVMPALKAAADMQNQLNAVISKRLSLENEFAAATKRQIDVTLEAAQIMQEFGGAAVTPEMQGQAAVDRLNVTGQQLGLTQVSAGSADEIRRRNTEIQTQMQSQGLVRAAAAGDAGAQRATGLSLEQAQAQTSSPEFQQREDRLKKAAEETYSETKKLIDARREEIKIINAKTAAEKKATEALLGNDVEAFLDEMAGKGAATAAAIGDPTLAAQFGVSDFGRANKQLEEMQKAGVTSFMGQDIGAVRQSAVGMGLTNAGLSGSIVTDLAKAATGTTDAAEAAKEAARDLASTLPQSTGNLQTSTENMLAATRILESNVEKEAEEATKRAEQRVDESKPPEEKTDKAEAKSREAESESKPPKQQESDAPPAVPPSTSEADTSGGTPPPSTQAQAEADSTDIQKVFVVNFPDMSASLAVASSVAKKQTTGSDSFLGIGGVGDLANKAFEYSPMGVMGNMMSQGGAMGGVMGKALQSSPAGLAARGLGLMETSSAPTVDSGVESQSALAGLPELTSSLSNLTTALSPLGGGFSTLTQSLTQVNNTMQAFSQSLNNMPSLDLSALDGLSSTFSSFNQTFSETVNKLEGLSINIKLAPTNVNVNITGGEFLQQIEERIRSDIMNKVATKISNIKHGPNGNHISSEGQLG